MNEPKIGEPFQATENEVIIPSYVKEDLDGWYVEFFYPEDNPAEYRDHYRRFITKKEDV